MDNNILSMKNRRAVAPIIATLILVAIAVVGGVMIFVFAQDFFGGESMTGPGTIDTISLAGYDLRDTTGNLKTHIATDQACTGCAAGGGLAVTDIGAIYIKNSGATAVTIQSITINDKKYGLVAKVDVIANFPSQKFTVYTEILAGGLMQEQADATIAGADTGTIFFRSADEIGAGRTISVTVTTGTGQEFSFNVVVGQKS